MRTKNILLKLGMDMIWLGGWLAVRAASRPPKVVATRATHMRTMRAPQPVVEVADDVARLRTDLARTRRAVSRVRHQLLRAALTDDVEPRRVLREAAQELRVVISGQDTQRAAERVERAERARR